MTLTLIGSLINGTSEAFWGMRNFTKEGSGRYRELRYISLGRMKGDDAEIDTAQTPKRFDRRLALLGKTRKTFTDSIPNKYCK